MSVRRPLHELTVAQARRQQAAEPVPARPDDRVEIVELAGHPPVRLFRPRGADPTPVCLWLSGGGWVLDTLDQAGAALHRLAAETPCSVAAVRYRLAPEHPFPAALDDGVAALRSIAANAAGLAVDSGRIAVGGASAGGNLAAAIALLVRDDPGVHLAAQILVYPPLLRGADTPSMRDVEADFDRRSVAWCWAQYLERSADGADPRASPLRAADLRGLPPTLVLTAEHDPLRDEAELYATRLQRAGVATDAVRVPGVTHGFFSGTDEVARGAQSRVVAALRRAFDRTTPTA